MNNFGKNIAVWVIISLVLVAIFNVFQGSSSQNTTNAIAYSDFLARVNAGEVREVSIQGDKISGASSSGVPFYSLIPKEEELANKLSEKGIKVTSEPIENGMPGIFSVLISWFPMLLFIGVWIFFMKQMQGGSKGAMGFGKSKAKLLQLVVTLSACAFLLVPTILSVMAGLTANYFKGISSGLTLKWVYQVWELYADSIFLSIWLALACLICTLLIGLPAAYGLARHPGWLSRLLEEFISLPLAVPGLALALALLQLYGSMKGFRASWAFILVGHVLYTLPFMVRSILAVLAAMDLKTLEEGAASLGASPWQRFRDIVVPNAMPGILAGALTVVTLSIGEFNLTWMLHTPYLKTLPVGLADSYASMRLEIASAYTLVFFVMIVPLLMAMQWASARAQRITQ